MSFKIFRSVKLIIDRGNTFSKLAVFQDDSLIHFENTSKDLLNEVKKIKATYPEIQSSILSSVAGVDDELIDFLTSSTKFIELDHQTKVPFINKYMTLETLGKDRIAIASAAVTMFPKENVLAIDMGTCITYDFVNSYSEYLGGSISPGFSLRFKSLHEFTHALPMLDLPKHEMEVNLTGSSTVDSISSGVVLGVKSELEGIIERYNTLYPQLKVIISGGDHNYFDSLVKNDIFAAPNIVVNGLKKILDFNEEK